MDRILLLMTATTYKASAFLDAARELGVEAVVATDRPQVLAALHPSGNLTCSFDDTEAGARTIAEHARAHPIRAILATDDEGTLLASRAGALLGLPHSPVEAVAAARSKLLTRERLAAAGLNGPVFRAVRLDADPGEASRAVGFPCVVKPLDLAASRGVMRADDPAQLDAALRRLAAIVASASSRGREPLALIERYIPGGEVALEGLLTAGALRALAIFDKPDPLEGPFFEETIYVTPSRHPAAVQDAIVSQTRRAVAALGLREGPIHAELRLTETGPFVLEIAPRSIGGLCARTLRFDGGRSLERLILEHAIGRDVRSIAREERAAGVMMIPIPARGTLRGVAGTDEALAVPGIEDLRITIPIGRDVVPLPEGSRYLGFLFARASEPREAEEALREAHRRLRFDIEPVPQS